MSPSLSTVCFSFVSVLCLLAQLTYVLLDIAIQELFPELNRVNQRSLYFPVELNIHLALDVFCAPLAHQVKGDSWIYY